jgi:hypothetical protein
MAEWHLKELRNAIERCGWRFIVEHPSEDLYVSASWEFMRSDKEPVLFIDFDGIDDLRTLPIEKSYGCRVRGRAGQGLYFSRKGSGDSVKRDTWSTELKAFVTSLNGTNEG